jgi:transposase-like protein
MDIKNKKPIVCPQCIFESEFVEIINKNGWFVKKYLCPECKLYFYVSINRGEAEEFNG